jgi:hypothetical protein
MARQQQVREVLWANPEGLTVKQIADMLGTDAVYIHAQVKKMVDTYILGWTDGGGRPRALWAVVVMPKNCPRPPKWERKKKGETTY